MAAKKDLNIPKVTIAEGTANNFFQQEREPGRPPKVGLKNAQFTLTMDPVTYERLRILSKDYSKGSISAIIDIAVHSFCNENDIDFDSIKVDKKILANYQKKQDEKEQKKRAKALKKEQKKKTL